ncbi:MAG: hypothetical protein P1V34_13465 [Alphaproteobacteria bacterium]|nr:hypothetical protein [Alphaproteobacteria bacterium]
MAASRTIILQSHNFQVLRGWIGPCVDSVRRWTEQRGYEYRFLGDEIFDLLPDDLRLKLQDHIAIQADLARLLLLRDALDNGYDRAVWFDADLLIFAPDRLEIESIPETNAFGRELWVDLDVGKRLKTWRNLHNAACIFRKGDPVLPFLIYATERIINDTAADKITMQMVGPKLLTALGNIVRFGRLNTVGALSPLVLKDIAAGGGPALDALKVAVTKDKLPAPTAANLRASLAHSPEAGNRMDTVVADLLRTGHLF